MCGSVCLLKGKSETEKGIAFKVVCYRNDLLWSLNSVLKSLRETGSLLWKFCSLAGRLNSTGKSAQRFVTVDIYGIHYKCFSLLDDCNKQNNPIIDRAECKYQGQMHSLCPLNFILFLGPRQKTNKQTKHAHIPPPTTKKTHQTSKFLKIVSQAV